jgi:ferredoxin
VTNHQVRIEGGAAFDAPDDETLLASALKAGLTMPNSCRTGTCRTCLRQLQSGRVTYRIEWPGVTPDEKDEGWILPCVAYPASDLVLGAEAQRTWWEGGG